jgi:F0F1-type ATP synthase membrane subunit b/b'
MRRVILATFLGLALATYALPQESKPATESAESEPAIGWKWANFLILAAGLGYLIGKSVPPLFKKQSSEIQGALRDAAKVKAEAAAEAAAIEARLANLKNEIEKLRVSARTDMTAEGERISRETEHHLQRIQEQTEQEIELLTRSAKAELRKYSAELALGLAEQRIRTRLDPATQQRLAEGFVQDLHARAPRTAN